jgi:hypothetical protein
LNQRHSHTPWVHMPVMPALCSAYVWPHRWHFRSLLLVVML